MDFAGEVSKEREDSKGCLSALASVAAIWIVLRHTSQPVLRRFSSLTQANGA